MAKLEIGDYDGLGPEGQTREVKITLSRRNLLALLHKLDMPNSNRRLENNVVYINRQLDNEHMLVLCCQDDAEHYNDSDRQAAQGMAGKMHSDSEDFIQRHWDKEW